MYGIIGSAVVLGIVLFRFFNSGKIKDYLGNKINIEPKKKGFSRNMIGGIIFGLGWGLIGACPGPMFILLGRGELTILVTIFGGLLGVLFYHVIKHKLPH